MSLRYIDGGYIVSVHMYINRFTHIFLLLYLQRTAEKLMVRLKVLEWQVLAVCVYGL